MSSRAYLEALQARLRAFCYQHGVLGLHHPDHLFDELNELECLIAHEERRLARATAPRTPLWAAVLRVLAVGRVEMRHG